METKIAFPQMLNKYRSLKNLTMEQLAEEVGKTKSTISKWEAGSRSPKIYEIEEIAKYFGVEPQTMMFGNTSKIQLIYDRLEPTRQENVISYAEKQLNEQENNIVSIFDDRKRVTAYVEGVVAAGLGSYQEENLHMEVELLEEAVPDKYDTIAQVVGDSMEPLIRNDDLLFIEVTSQIDTNSIGIFQVNGKNFVKKLKRDYGGAWYLQSLNNNYEEIYLTEDDDIRTIGEVVGIYRED
ncbi:XRE family transcriptional regulator [Streptococcus suis]|uniref:XRE family transcriptional regulator n=2 Tax=Streptococcus suis TaxID=1307 RepID=UPI000CF3F70D|nr:XRE family transcriptional regulator [Streptococcus suis]MCO8220650.1 XRE family transcriptional regulator [Streptococcus suis]